MSELQRFTAQDQDLLVGIFYRVGYWISHIDDTDIGTESEEKELKQMMVILDKISQSTKTSPVVAELAAESIRQNSYWKRWEGKNLEIENDLRSAAKIMKGQSNPTEYKSFSNALMVIATSVARAFREEPENEPEHENYFSWISEKARELSLALNDSSAHKDLSISPAEDTALNELFTILNEA